MAKAPLRVAILGGGIFAREAHAPVLIDLTNRGLVEVVACWSRSKESADQLAQIYASKLADGRAPDAFGGDAAVDDLLARSDIGAFIVVLPINLQDKYAVRCMQAGKHVLTEKPIAGSVADAQEAIRVYEQCKSALHYCVAENYRFEGALRYAAHEVRSSCGQVLTVNMTAFVPFTRDSKYEKTQWRRDSEHIGGVLLDSAVHFMAGLQHVLGARITAVSTFTTKKSDHLPQADSFNATLQFGSTFNASAAVTYATNVARSFQIVVCGTEGLVDVSRSYEPGKAGYNVTTTDATGTRTEFLAFCGIERELEAFVKLCLEETPTDPMDPDMLSPLHAFADLAVIETLIRAEEASLTKVPDVFV